MFDGNVVSRVLDMPDPGCAAAAGRRRIDLHRLAGFGEKLGIDIQFHSYWEAYSKQFVEEHLESGDCPAHAAEFETSIALAAFPENAHWEGVDYEAETFDIQSESYREQDPRYAQAARLATPHKGRIMIDTAVEWVAGRMTEMMESDVQ